MLKKCILFLCIFAFSFLKLSCLNSDNKLTKKQLEAYADSFGVSADEAIHFLNEGGELTLKSSQPSTFGQVGFAYTLTSNENIPFTLETNDDGSYTLKLKEEVNRDELPDQISVPFEVTLWIEKTKSFAIRNVKMLVDTRPTEEERKEHKEKIIDYIRYRQLGNR